MGLHRRRNGSVDQRLHHTGNQSFVGHHVTSTMFCEVRDLVHDDLPTCAPHRIGPLASGRPGAKDPPSSADRKELTDSAGDLDVLAGGDHQDVQGGIG